jgi:aminopeptidase N
VPWVVRDIRLERATDLNRLNTFRPNAEAEAQSTPSFRYWPGTSVAITYDKSALWLHTLERHLGWPVMQRILATYSARWKFRHPRPADFFQIASEVSGQDLTWFVDQVHRSSNTFDYGVQDVVSETLDGGTYRTTVVARRFGEATFPVDVVTTFGNGEQVTERWDGVDRRAIYVYEKPARATLAQVDPQRVLLLDVDYTNNSRLTEPRSAEASLKWTATWLTWLQDLMLTYAFFV